MFQILDQRVRNTAGCPVRTPSIRMTTTRAAPICRIMILITRICDPRPTCSTRIPRTPAALIMTTTRTTSPTTPIMVSPQSLSFLPYSFFFFLPSATRLILSSRNAAKALHKLCILLKYSMKVINTQLTQYRTLYSLALPKATN